MTNFDLPLELLRQNDRLVILQTFYNYCDENNVNEIKYSRLRELCDELLGKVNRGFPALKTNFGGQFETLVKHFESREEPSRRLISRDKRGPKATVLVAELAKIKDELERAKLSGAMSVGEIELVEQPTDPKVWQREKARVWKYLMTEDGLLKQMRRGKDHDFFLNLASDLNAIKQYRAIGFSVLAESGKKFEMGETETRLLVYLLYLLHGRNNFRFNLICTRELLKDEQTKGPIDRAFNEKKIEYFCDWSRLYQKFMIPEAIREKLLDHMNTGKELKLGYSNTDVKVYKLWSEFQDRYTKMIMVPLRKSWKLPSLDWEG